MKRYFQLLVILMVIRTIFLGWYISQGYIGLGPDEAQYWTWSQDLDWGYYSKPPGIAFQIKLGTFLFGNTELGVRFGSLVLGTLLPFGIWILCIAGGLGMQIAFWSALAMAFSPLGIAASVFAITDVGMVFFWISACCPVAWAMQRKTTPFYVIAGIFIALGALFKWPVYFFWLVILVSMIFFPILRSASFLTGFLVSLAGLIPPLLWNMQHNWVTFRHVEATMVGQHIGEAGTTALMKGNALEFLGAQAALLSPILFILLVACWIAVLPKMKSEKIPTLVKWGALSSALLIGGYIFAAFFQKMQGNWCDFAYPLAIPALVWISTTWTCRGVWFSAFCTLALLILPLPFHPFKYNLGWKKIAPLLEQAGYDPSRHFLFAESYQMASILSFYGPAQKRAYFFNLEGARHNQFDLWPGMPEEQKGKTGYFVQVNYGGKKNKAIPEKTKQLANYFVAIRDLGMYPIDNYNSKSIQILMCEIYSGDKAKTSLYY